MMSHKPSLQITESAIERLLRGEALSESDDNIVVLRVFLDDTYQHNFCVLHTGIAEDGSKACARVGLLHKPNFRLVGGDYVYILLISGIVVSTVNTNVSEPLLYLVDWELLETLDCPLRCPLRPSNSSFLRLPAAKVSGGLIFEFFSNIMPVLSTTDLAGGTFLEDNHRQQENEITHFLEHHKALQTISRVVSGTTSLFGDNAPTIQQSEYYQSALREFVSAQLDRQKASLTSNTGRQDAATSTKIAEQHALCLKRALEDDLTAPGLTPELLCRWHGILCGEGLHVHAGKLRPRNVHVRVGNVSFRPSSHIAGDLDQVCRALNALEGRLFHSDQHPTTHSGNDNHQRSVARDASPGLAAVTFAVAVFFGIGDTHAFADGNGRLARIAANWALRRAGLPFCVHFFATAVQRKEYSTATSLTRRNLYLKSRGHVSQERLLDCFRDGKCLQPLVVLFLDRIHKAVAEFSALVKEKSSLSLDQNEARAARMFRERAATGNCFICFEQNPNIATLCCGKPVHLNCMAEWLSSKNSCPQCRSDLPSLPPRMRVPEPNEQEDADETSETIEDNTSVDSNDSTTAEEGDDETTTSDAPMEASVGSTTEEDETTDQTFSQRPDLPPFCAHGHCSNRSAKDCSNSCCGLCCIMHGRYSCPRHNAP